MDVLILWRYLNNKCAITQGVYVIEKILIAVIIAANDKIVTTKETVPNAVVVRTWNVKGIQLCSVFNTIKPEGIGTAECEYRTVLCRNIWRIRNMDGIKCTAIGKI